MENTILYITSAGTLSRKDNTLYFENEVMKKVIPLSGIEQIYCIAEVTVNSKLLQFLTENKIFLHFFNYHEYYIGSYSPKEAYISGKLLVQQVDHYQNGEKRCVIARSFVHGIAANMVALLEHYQRHEKDVGTYISRLKQALWGLPGLKTIPEILAVEGLVWEIFYSSFSRILPEEFVIASRVRRPPDNPMNALISFGNSLLYTYTLSKIYHTQLNPTISYLHEPSERRFSLALDVSEVFKLPLVFGLIFSLVNKKMIRVEDHFDKKLNNALLNDEGRKVFCRAWDERLQKTAPHPILKRSVSQGSLIKYDCFKLIKHILGEKEFVPYRSVDGY